MILVAHLTCPPHLPNVDDISENLIERRIDAQVDEQEPKLRLRDQVAIGRPIGSWGDSLLGASVCSDVGSKIPLIDHGALLAVVAYEQRLDARANFGQCQVSSSARSKSREELFSPLT
jgi:hypothetical protein